MVTDSPDSVAETPQSSGDVPLCIDLDGTLIHSDTLLEAGLLLLKRNPLYLFSLFFWLLSGKAHLKEQIASRTEIDVALLPYNRVLLEWLQEQSATRPLVLVTAANSRIAEAVADHLAIFRQVIASSAQYNMSAGNKRNELDTVFGKGGYDYVGNSQADLKVWAHCRRAVVVNARASVASSAAAVALIEKEFPNTHKTLPELLGAMRPNQWSKNLLLFVNILMAHQLTDVGLLLSTVIAFVAFCLCSSSVYLINDMLDIEADRQHAEKHSRPFASGRVPFVAGIVAVPVLLICAFTLSFYAGGTFPLCLATYFLITLGYSFYLKRIVILDVLVLAILYTLRIIAGASVAGVMPSFWLMSFSLFIFTSLAMAKRYAELKSMEKNSDAWVSGRGYHVGDLAVIANLGVASGYIATLVLALYIDSPDVVQLYQDEGFIWLLCPLLMYWIGRIWLLATRGDLHQDPVIFATRDRISYLILLLGLLTLSVAL
jgi:4-hydroxybenzoate polyprenyltransferase/phosphoserine phosphatase